MATLARGPSSAGETPPPRPSWLNHQLIRVASFATLIIGLWWLLSRIDLARTGAILQQARPLPIVLACLANLLSQVTRAAGWAVLLAEYRIPFSRLVPAAPGTPPGRTASVPRLDRPPAARPGPDRP